ncbi:hypothetical protein GYA19_01070 [Candidatus Beckwithbacteria bacterium]|nr:hypothetical protein [Candidatus Beckwithbacteria bacterium]
MKNLYLIISKTPSKTALITFNLITKSAEERNIKIHKIFVEDFDFSQEIKFTKEDGLYRISTGNKSALIEKYLINSEVKVLYQNNKFCLGKLTHNIGSSLIHQKLDLPIIKTIFEITNNRELLKKYVRYLDGFPIIIKAIGGSHGIGIMKIDSFESLASVCDYLVNKGNNFIMRKYIDYIKHARLIVLGDRVISSIEYKRVNGDFRSNVGDKIDVVEENFGELVNKTAVDSVNALGYEFGGVDILIDQNNNHYIAEVNFPCYFARTQNATGFDISGAMLDYLIQK